MEWLILIVVLSNKGVAVEKVPFAWGGCEAAAERLTEDLDAYARRIFVTCIDASGEGK